MDSRAASADSDASSATGAALSAAVDSLCCCWGESAVGLETESVTGVPAEGVDVGSVAADFEPFV